MTAQCPSSFAFRSLLLLSSFLLLLTGVFFTEGTEENGDNMPEPSIGNAAALSMMQDVSVGKKDSSTTSPTSLEPPDDNSSSDLATPPPNSTSLTAANNSVTPTTEMTHSPTTSLTVSPTPSLEDVPDNMYTRAESCDIPIVNKCVERFCNCISRGQLQNANRSWYIKNGVYQCHEFANANCYYNLYCARERVSCLWSASFLYKAYRPQGNTLATSYELSQKNSQGNMPCVGLEDIQGNFSQLTKNTNYYDSLFYSECVDYVTFILQRTGDGICAASIVPMYVCGDSLFPVPPTRQIHYTPLSEGARRLVISIVARIVGNFTPIFNSERAKYNEKYQMNIENQLSKAMYSCFFSAIGIKGVFSVKHEDECLVVRYEVGVGEADPWVGDVVTANALSLMVRSASWMDPAQRVIGNITDSVKLSAPIVVYYVSFESGTGQPEAKLCDAGCSVAISLVLFLTLIAFAFSCVFCCRPSRRPYFMFDDDHDFEEMESIKGRRAIVPNRK
ncbi:hypothetical protein TcG_04770 [Trypanosoma cruzi]|nr:hypothetical protein TcG_04770 [Trypanosoma cruzi]